MKIEILTRDVGKKAEILTYLKGLNGFRPEGGLFLAEGLEAEITDSYMLFTLTLPWLADNLNRRLFTVKPASFSTGFYEIECPQKIIVTCSARPLTRLVSSLDILEHLDLEAGEICGRIEKRWTSRDVSLSAHFEVIIQGGLAIVKVKFSPHFRESELHCRNAVSMVNLTEGLDLITPERENFHQPASMSPVVSTASAHIDEGVLEVFFNRSPGEIYFSETGDFQVDLPGRDNRIEISRKKENRVELELYLTEPWNTGDHFANLLSILKIKQLEISRIITGITLSPRDLMSQLGFIKDREFHVFKASPQGLEASYNIGRREMRIQGSINCEYINNSFELFKSMEEFTSRVMHFAV